MRVYCYRAADLDLPVLGRSDATIPPVSVSDDVIRRMARQAAEAAGVQKRLAMVTTAPSADTIVDNMSLSFTILQFCAILAASDSIMEHAFVDDLAPPSPIHADVAAETETCVRAPLQVSIYEAAYMLGVCRMTLYRMRAAGEIHFGKLRNRTMVPMAEVHRVHKATAAAGAPNPVTQPVIQPRIRRPKKVKLHPSFNR